MIEKTNYTSYNDLALLISFRARQEFVESLLFWTHSKKVMHWETVTNSKKEIIFHQLQSPRVTKKFAIFHLDFMYILHSTCRTLYFEGKWIFCLSVKVCTIIILMTNSWTMSVLVHIFYESIVWKSNRKSAPNHEANSQIFYCQIASNLVAASLFLQILNWLSNNHCVLTYLLTLTQESKKNVIFFYVFENEWMA